MPPSSSQKSEVLGYIAAPLFFIIIINTAIFPPMLSVKLGTSFKVSSRSINILANNGQRNGRFAYSSLTECSLTRMEGVDKGIAVLQMNRPEAKNAISNFFKIIPVTLLIFPSKAAIFWLNSVTV